MAPDDVAESTAEALATAPGDAAANAALREAAPVTSHVETPASIPPPAIAALDCGAAPPYDENHRVKRPGLVTRLFVSQPRWLLALLRRLWPIPRLPGFRWALRYEDVTEVLRNPRVFQVPFGGEITRMNGGGGNGNGTPFLLGTDDPATRRHQLPVVMRSFPLEDVSSLVVPGSRQEARSRVTNAAGAMEAIHELATAVPLWLCNHYFGIPIPDPGKFAYATLDVSAHLFGAPPIERPPPDAPEEHAAAYIRWVVHCAVEHARLGEAKPGTPLARLAAEATANNISWDEVQAILIGMIVGFVPTNTIATGHILDVLLDHPDRLLAARSAARSGDDDLLARCLFEAMRFKPLNPGPFRVCSETYVLGADRRGEVTIAPGTFVLAGTHAAMFDPDAVTDPYNFDPARAASDILLFGHGLHWCVGAFIARAQITQTLKPLILQEKLRRNPVDGKLVCRGLFPERLRVVW